MLELYNKKKLIPNIITWSPKLGIEPRLGDVAKGGDVTNYHTVCHYILHACEKCGKQRWVPFSRYSSGVCKICHECVPERHKPPHYLGERHWNWRGGRYISKGKYKGYVMIWVDPNDFYAPMGGVRGYAPEHRLVMAKSLDRCLQSWENVHHKNGNKQDNRIENLELTTNGSHHIEHHRGYKDGFQKGFQDGKDAHIKELCRKIEDLEWKLTQVC